MMGAGLGKNPRSGGGEAGGRRAVTLLCWGGHRGWGGGRGVCNITGHTVGLDV